MLPALSDVARVTRRSTSAGLSRSDTGEALPGSDGVHVYVEEKDGADSERFLKALHERCWLAGSRMDDGRRQRRPAGTLDH